MSLIKFIIRAFCVMALLIALVSCDAQKRINRILNRNPELKRDTVLTIYDTTKVPGHKIDTLVNWLVHKDTITINKNNVITKVFIHRDSVFISSQAKPQILFKTIRVPYTRIIYQTDDKKRWQFLWIGAAVALFIIVLLIILLFIYGPKKI